jgi:hypothetical protein
MELLLSLSRLTTLSMEVDPFDSGLANFMWSWEWCLLGGRCRVEMFDLFFGDWTEVSFGVLTHRSTGAVICVGDLVEESGTSPSEEPLKVGSMTEEPKRGDVLWPGILSISLEMMFILYWLRHLWEQNWSKLLPSWKST